MTLPSSLRYDFFDSELQIKDKKVVTKERVPNPYDYIDKLTKKCIKDQKDR